MNANPTILVAEDDFNDVILLAVAFKKAVSPATVHFVGDGREAIHYLRGNGPYGDRAQFPFPNLFMVNLGLLGMTGFDLLDWVRQQPFLQRLVIGVLSGMDHGPDIHKARAMGAKFCVVKPHTFQELVVMAGQLTVEGEAGLDTPVISSNLGDKYLQSDAAYVQ